MVKREALRQKLKAAERRRQRRQGESPLAAGTGSAAGLNNAGPNNAGPRADLKSHAGPPSIDVTGLVVQTILQHSLGQAAEARDAMVVAAMRSCLRATTPNGQDARSLVEKLNEIPNRPGVSMRAYRYSLQQLLALASANHDPRRSDAFLGYLAVISEQ